MVIKRTLSRSPQGPEDDVLFATSDSMLWLRVFLLELSRLKI
jgi:hypothetical protein